MGERTGEDQRNGPKDRRTATPDRRNAERVAEDLNPRRDPERRGRRSDD
jgi:hypothetical protein